MNRRSILTYTVMLACGAGILMVAAVPAAESKVAKKYTETVTAKDGSKLSFDMVLVPGVTTGRGTQSSLAHQGRIIIQGAGRQAMSNSRQFSNRVRLASDAGSTPSL